MDSKRLIERIENGELSFTEGNVEVELEAADTLGVLLKRIVIETNSRPADPKTALRKQSASIVARLSYLDTLKVIEVDGIANAVQIRSEKPSDEGFTEVILRGGRSVSLQRRGSALHISKKTLERLFTDLLNSGSDASDPH